MTFCPASAQLESSLNDLPYISVSEPPGKWNRYSDNIKRGKKRCTGQMNMEIYVQKFPGRLVICSAAQLGCFRAWWLGLVLSHTPWESLTSPALNSVLICAFSMLNLDWRNPFSSSTVWDIILTFRSKNVNMEDVLVWDEKMRSDSVSWYLYIVVVFNRTFCIRYLFLRKTRLTSIFFLGVSW